MQRGGSEGAWRKKKGNRKGRRGEREKSEEISEGTRRKEEGLMMVIMEIQIK